MDKFIFTAPDNRQQQRLTQCPPHIRKKYLRGLARLVRMEKRIHTHDTVTASMREIKFVFTDEETWQPSLYDDMTPEDQNSANLAWAEANEAEEEEEITEETPGVKLCPNIDTNAIRNQMKYYMKSKLRWSNRALHDASVWAGLNTPSRPSLLNYFNTLRLQFSDPKAGFLPQTYQSHTKPRILAVLKCLSNAGLKIGGKMADPKSVLMERLAYWLDQVIQAGRTVGKSSGTDGEHSSDDEIQKDRSHKEPVILNPDSTQLGEIPHDAQVTTEQADSALGHNQSTELDGDSFELFDLDQREEEEALQGRYVNPEYLSDTTRIDYDCLCWSSEDLAPDSVSAKTVGWMPALKLRMVSKSDFSCTMEKLKENFMLESRNCTRVSKINLARLARGPNSTDV